MGRRCIYEGRIGHRHMATEPEVVLIFDDINPECVFINTTAQRFARTAHALALKLGRVLGQATRRKKGR